jgi:hypothetical protein
VFGLIIATIIRRSKAETDMRGPATIGRTLMIIATSATSAGAAAINLLRRHEPLAQEGADEITTRLGHKLPAHCEAWV